MRTLIRALLGAGVVAMALAGGADPALASPTSPHNPQPPAGIGSGRVIVLRPHRADLVNNHVVVRVVPLPAGPVQLEVLIRAIGDVRWASFANGTATLDAGLLQRPTTTLEIATPVHTVRLVDSDTSPAYLAGSNASITFSGVTVVSAAGSDTAAESLHRPYVRYVHSSVTATGSTFSALGSRAVRGATGVTIGSGSVLTASGSTFKDSGIGLDVDAAARATLNGVTATGNATAGVDLKNVQFADLDGLTASGNPTGLQLRGTVPSRMNAITLTNNSIGLRVGEVGRVAAGGDGITLGPLATDHNTVAGVALTGCPGCRVQGLTSSGDTTGVRLGVLSTGATVRDSTITGSITGIEVAASHASVENVRITGAGASIGIHVDTVAAGAKVTRATVGGGAIGILIDGPGATLATSTVTASTIGLQLGATATDAAISQVATSEAETGLAINGGAARISVAGFTAANNTGLGIRSGAADVTIIDPTISGGRVGLDLKGAANVTGGVVSDVAEAVRVGANGQVRMTAISLHAHVLGLRVANSGHLSLTHSQVDAPLGVRGNVTIDRDTKFPALPLRWLGLVALVALVAAVVLETLRRLREHHHDASVTAPTHVLNTA